MTTVPNITDEDIYNRLISQIVPWFGIQQFVPNPTLNNNGLTPTTNFNTILWAFIITAFENYSQMQYVWMQTRIGQTAINFATQFPGQPNPFPEATDNNLDLISQDFFGTLLPRRPNESDANYRNRILVNVMKLKATRPAMLAALIALVTPVFAAAGYSPLPLMWYPQIYEGWYASDNGVLNWDMPPTLAFNAIGSYGTGSPYTANITVFLPHANGLGNHPGLLTPGESITWGAGLGNDALMPQNQPTMWLGSDSLLMLQVTMSDIQNVINLTKVLGTLINLTIVYVPNANQPFPELENWIDNLNNTFIDNFGNNIIFNVT